MVANTARRSSAMAAASDFSPAPTTQRAKRIKGSGEGERMALGKEIGSFSFKLTSVSYAGPEGSAQLNVDGNADRYGTVLGTLVLSGAAGAKNGSASWRGEGFLENGDVVAGTGEGSWQK